MMNGLHLMFQKSLRVFHYRSAAMPVTLQCMDEVGIDPRISHFVVPIGVICNMDGTALFISIASVFIAQMNNIPLGSGDYITIG